MPYELTESNLQTAWKQQLQHAQTMIADALANGGTGDDGHDYLIAALDLASTLEDLRYDSDIAGLTLLLKYDESDENGDWAPLDRSYATDGVCEYIYSLQHMINGNFG